MKKLVIALVLGTVLMSGADATAGDRRPSMIRKVSARGPRLIGNRVSFFQEPVLGPAVEADSLPPTPAAPLTPVPEGGYVLPPDGQSFMMPGPGVVGPGMAGPGLAGPVMMDPGAAELFPCVKYEDKDHIHPCAVTKIIAVKDPRPACECGPSGCVYVAVCVPPGCPKVKVKHHGRKVKYDYGDYQVEIESEDGKVFVDYDD